MANIKLNHSFFTQAKTILSHYRINSDFLIFVRNMKGSLKKLITFNQCPKTPFSSQKRSDPKFWTLIESDNFFLEIAAIEGEDRVKFF